MASDEDKWVLHYWPGFAGRGEFVRIIFEEVGEPYVNNHDQCKDYFYGGKARFGEADFFPSFAPPLLQKGDFSLSSTPAICKYLATKFGLVPEKEEDRWHAEQVNGAIHDYLSEGNLSFHGIDPVASYYDQKEATQPYIKQFLKDRFPKWLRHFEAVLRANEGGKGFLIGDKLTYVDLALLQVLRVTASQFPEEWKEASEDYAKLLSAYKDRLSARPKLAAYFASDRCRPFAGASMM